MSCGHEGAERDLAEDVERRSARRVHPPRARSRERQVLEAQQVERLGDDESSRVAGVEGQRRLAAILELDVDVRRGQLLAPPEAVVRPDDTHLRAFSDARDMSPPHCTSDPEASFRRYPVYATALSTMDKPKDCAGGGAVLDMNPATVSQQPLSLVVKPPAAAGGETIRDDSN